jgi:hypothetical protein
MLLDLQAEAAGLDKDTPMLQVLVDEVRRVKGEQPSTPNTVYPLPKPITDVVQFSTMPMGHFNYAVGWGCMSGAMVYMAYNFMRKAKLKR